MDAGLKIPKDSGAYTMFQVPESSIRNLVYLLNLSFIGVVSIYDAYLVVKYKEVIADLEKNPICLFLIQLDPDSLICFLLGKATGTVLVLTILSALFCYKPRFAWPAVFAIAFFQFGLFCFLNFSNGSYHP